MAATITKHLTYYFYPSKTCKILLFVIAKHQTQNHLAKPAMYCTHQDSKLYRTRNQPSIYSFYVSSIQKEVNLSKLKGVRNKKEDNCNHLSNRPWWKNDPREEKNMIILNYLKRQQKKNPTLYRCVPCKSTVYILTSNLIKYEILMCDYKPKDGMLWFDKILILIGAVVALYIVPN